MQQRAVALAALLLGACKASPAPSPSPASGPVGESSWETPGFAGRPYRVNAPANLDRAKGAPVVVLLHGFGGNGDNLGRYFRLGPVTSRHGALLLTLEGTPNRDGARFWNAGQACCDLYGQAPDDVAYIDAILDDLAHHFRIDPKRVYLAGHSNGGFMAHHYACERAERVAAIVSLAGPDLADGTRCRPREPVSVLQVHGDADEIVPYRGGNFSAPDPGGHQRLPFVLPPGLRMATFAGARATVEAWATRDGCSPAEDPDVPSLDLDGRIPGSETLVTRWSHCKAGAVELWTIQGGDHVPSLRPTWGEQIYSFFDAHPKP